MLVVRKTKDCRNDKKEVRKEAAIVLVLALFFL
jgi:hypothetical protein